MLNSKAIVAALAVTLSLVGVSESFARDGHGFGGGGGAMRMGGGGGGAAHFSAPRMGGSNFARPSMAGAQFRGPVAGNQFRAAGPQRFAGAGVQQSWNGGGQNWGHHRHHRGFYPGIGIGIGLGFGAA